MTITQYTTIKEALVTEAERVTNYEDMTDEIKRMEAVQGTIIEVTFKSDNGQVHVRDADMLSKAELALSKLITLKKGERTAI